MSLQGAQTFTLVHVQARLITPYITHAPADSLQLDSMLSFLYFDRSTQQAGLQIVDLPSLFLRDTLEGKPLWACTPLVPETPVTHSTVYTHTRIPDYRMHRVRPGQRNVQKKVGRWKVKRLSRRLTHTARIGCLALADPERLQAELQIITYVGADAKAGRGRVAQWQVAPIQAPTDAGDLVLTGRTVPFAHLHGRDIRGDDFDVFPPVYQYLPWTPPYWHLPWFAYCRPSPYRTARQLVGAEDVPHDGTDNPRPVMHLDEAADMDWLGAMREL